MASISVPIQVNLPDNWLDLIVERVKTDDDWVAVTRCKDCRHWYADADTGMACEFTNMGQPEDGFCNWAEAKGGRDVDTSDR